MSTTLPDNYTEATLYKNFSALEDIDPMLVKRLCWPVDGGHVIFSSSGIATYLHHKSSYPLDVGPGPRSAPPQVEQPLCFGVGLGELVEEWLAKDEAPALVAWERDPWLLRLALMRYDWSTPLNRGRLKLLLGADLLEYRRKQAFDVVVPHPLLSQLYDAEWDIVGEGVKEEIAVLCEGGLFEADVRRALVAEGFSVLPLGFQKLSVEELVHSLRGAAPVFVCSINYANGLAELCAQLELPLLCWEVDPATSPLRRLQRACPDARIFTYREANIAQFRAAGFENVEYLPLAADPEVRLPLGTHRQGSGQARRKAGGTRGKPLGTFRQGSGQTRRKAGGTRGKPLGTHRQDSGQARRKAADTRGAPPGNLRQDSGQARQSTPGAQDEGGGEGNIEDAIVEALLAVGNLAEQDSAQQDSPESGRKDVAEGVNKKAAADVSTGDDFEKEQGPDAGRVAFVGSSMVAEAARYRQMLDAYLQRDAYNPGAVGLLDAALVAQRQDFSRFLLPEELSPGLMGAFEGFQDAHAGMDALALIAEISASEKRLAYLRAVAPLGLDLWGDEGWHQVESAGARYRGLAGHTHELNRIYGQAAINIDIGRLYQMDIVTMRVFDVLACGGFVLAEYSPALEGLFKIGEEIDCYRSVDELVDKCAHYLALPAARQEMAERGRAAVLERHRVDQRVRRMLEQVGRPLVQLSKIR